jgi:hypothetical protein
VSIALVSLIALVLAAPLIARGAQRRWDIFEPYVLFAIAYGVMFVLRPIYMIATNNYEYLTPLSRTDVRSGFERMLVVALLGAVGFAVGYFSPLSRKLAPQSARGQTTDLRRVARVGAIFAIVGAVSLFAVVLHAGGWRGLLLIFRGRTPGLSTAIASTSFYPWAATLTLVPAGLVFLALACENRQKRLWAAFALVGLLVGLRAAPEGDRTILLMFVGGALVLLYLRRLTRPKLLPVVALIICAVYVSTFLSDLRGRSTRGQSVTQTLVNVATNPASVWKRIASGPDTEMAPVLAAAVEVIPSKRSYTYGTTTLGDLVFRPVPRALWSAKPESPRVQLISVLWPADSKRQAINPEFSILLYPYWDFGFVGVIMTLVVFGVAARSLQEYGRSLAQDIPGQVFFSLAVWLVVVGLRDTPVETLVRAVFVIGPVLVTMRANHRGRQVVDPTVRGNTTVSSESGERDHRVRPVESR